MTAMTANHLRSHPGYREFSTSNSLSHPKASTMFQRTVWSEDEEYKLYFIQVYYYDYEQLRNEYPGLPKNFPNSFTVTVNLFPRNGVAEPLRVSMDFKEGERSIEIIENEISKMFRLLDCIPDPLNN